MSLSDVVTVKITSQNPGLTAAGFGIPLFPSATAVWVERTRTYNDIDGVQADWPPTTPEYHAAAAYFDQDPAPPTIMIGRLGNKPTQTFTIGIATVIAVAGTHYKVRINDLSTGAAGAGVGPVADFATVGGDTNDSIVAGIVAAITALGIAGVGAAATGGVGSKVVTVTMTAGKWIGIEVYDVANGAVGGLMDLAETTADPGLTADLIAINTESKAWYGLNLLFKSSALVLAAAAWVETNTKLFPVATADTLTATQALGVGTDVLQSLKAEAYARTAPFFHPRNDEFADCAETGRFFPISPGGDDWNMKSLAGVTPAALTETQTTNLTAKLCNWYYALSGNGAANAINVIGGEGLVSANEYIDNIRFRDWWVAQVQVGIVNERYNANKIPFDDFGIARLEKIVRKVNARGVAAGGILAGSDSVTAPLAANVPLADRQARTLNDLNASWEFAEAINKIAVNAQVSA
jgi:hypothetical protein